MLVLNRPGSIMLTSTPHGLISRLRASEKASTPYLEIQYAEPLGTDIRPVKLLDYKKKIH